MTEPRPAGHDPASAWLRTMLTTQVATVRRTEIPSCEGDPDALHDLRVALRRSRSLLTTFGSLLPDDTGDLVEALRAAGLALGSTRDRDVIHQVLTDVAAESGGPDAETVAQLLRADEPAPLRLPDGIVQELGETALDVPDLSPEEGWPLLAAEWRRLHKRVEHAAASTGEERVEALHRVRKTGKRVRYAAETLTPVYSRKAGRTAELARAVQDALGTHRDTVLVRAWLRERAAHGGGDPFLVGRLDRRVDELGEEALRRYEDLVPDLRGHRVRRTPPRR